MTLGTVRNILKHETEITYPIGTTNMNAIRIPKNREATVAWVGKAKMAIKPKPIAATRMDAYHHSGTSL
jgi:hypothetical protein